MNSRIEMTRVHNRIIRSLSIIRLRNQIHNITLGLVFCVIASVVSIVLNHNGVMLSYGIIVSGCCLLVVALFLSLRIKLQMKLNDAKDDYGRLIVAPLVQYFFNGSFSSKGSLTEREILISSLFSDGSRYMYDSMNEIKGSYKGVQFEASDMRERHSDDNDAVLGKIFSFQIQTSNVNPVIFKYINAPSIHHENGMINRVGVNDSDISSRYEVYAFDSKEASRALTEELSKKLKNMLLLELGNSLKISFYNGKIYVYFDMEEDGFKEVLTKKDDPTEEIHKVCQQLELICSLVEVMA